MTIEQKIGDVPNANPMSETEIKEWIENARRKPEETGWQDAFQAIGEFMGEAIDAVTGTMEIVGEVAVAVVSCAADIISATLDD